MNQALTGSFVTHLDAIILDEIMLSFISLVHKQFFPNFKNRMKCPVIRMICPSDDFVNRMICPSDDLSGYLINVEL